ncbi:DUF881 domain-containing protein [Sporosarcina sp. JAI121]|uniref:DUF881 domain-containing protein n=1 Tax=Sporosarcina sp. JAI121 TaxID=2723064 RepID=UPI0015CD1D62|nr:DUF881 domain-containing protein [Sporosarcina sp. JAI121]NYF24143.1 uncharacterized protein YlxW (UPF0749 family) [Sporosarcina sp. JAI121]
MTKKVRNDYKRRGRSILFSVVFLVLGFILAFSYRTLGINQEANTVKPSHFIQEEDYREMLISQQERNKELTDEIAAKQEEIREYERSFSTGKKNHAGLVEEAKDLRLLLGVIPAVGQGVKVTLKDADYDPVEQNPNDYIVHESHILRIVNELRISGAQGLAINGQRITSNSHIQCTGPVITVDGKTFPAPFVIEAVGDMNVLSSALHLKGGVVDSLIRDNIVVTTEQSKDIRLSALRDES